ncbi:hypothetical protein EMIHUDRAFT_459434 [Emiliania huxleyi CCMP1516]|uniref:Uncharacterized protein n=2 Tax=Emiliania huxleyi TaxID=2903 RepID=A0A0D3ISH7_EMIH1|nr:hypothetical protein EMIHUDRAFT_459434 [Emiliania huxleyi CCMP1516]EOD14212.1 hypothetical protein EMIHUDRAFT_459434 [Emiliania huxleyi CCMP1516]|eukprot:XP_005766641.1 hypothetical protein EMIHUDRAFT_459434 [Emiliania huxleyi CCMP1516]
MVVALVLWSSGAAAYHRPTPLARPLLAAGGPRLACVSRHRAPPPSCCQQPPVGDGAAAASTPAMLSLAAVVPFLSLVSVKTATDLITNHVRRPPATAMALVSEIAIFPLIVAWLVVGNGVRRLRGASAAGDRDIGAVFRRAITEQPLRLSAIGSVYALDNMLYFFAQSNVGAVTYTVLAQAKIFFTVAALRMRGMLGPLRPQQMLGLSCLFGGAVLVALKDVATGVAASSGNRALGIAGLLCAQAKAPSSHTLQRHYRDTSPRPEAQAMTSFANVAYERQLREPGCDLWVRNAAILGSGGVPPSPAALLAAFRAPWVWLVAASAVLIALTISAGGNVLYAISKPWPVVFATLTTCVVLGNVPSLGFLGGIALSVSGIGLYYAARA